MIECLVLTMGLLGADADGLSGREIQAAIDRAAAQGGGEVPVAAGTYDLDDSLHLRSGVKIGGEGEKTVLRKRPSVSSPLAADLGYGHYDVSLAEPDKFRVGMGVHVHDDRSGGFYDTVATLIWREGDRFGIDRMLNHDYGRKANAAVTSVFPVLSGYHLDCTLEGMTGLGLHPGSGSVGAVLRGNTCRNNGSDGIFYCLRVSFSLCENNVVENNGRYGISIGGRDTDHLVRRNTIRGNVRAGVFFREHDLAMAGSRNQIEENLLENNCRKEGLAEIEIQGAVRDVHVWKNTLRPGARGGKPLPGVFVGPHAERIVVYENKVGSSGIEVGDRHLVLPPDGNM